MRKVVVLVALVLFFCAFAWSVWQKEQALRDGDIVLVRLAPKDPRAFLLGDYMELNYDLNRQIYNTLREKKVKTRDGTVVVRLDEHKVADFVRLDDGIALQVAEHRLYFRVRHGRAHVAADSFFFQEGLAEDYEEAKYGKLRVDAHGRSLLTHLLDSDLREIPAVEAIPD